MLKLDETQLEAVSVENCLTEQNTRLEKYHTKISFRANVFIYPVYTMTGHF